MKYLLVIISITLSSGCATTRHEEVLPQNRWIYEQNHPVSTWWKNFKEEFLMSMRQNAALARHDYSGMYSGMAEQIKVSEKTYVPPRAPSHPCNKTQDGGLVAYCPDNN